MSVNEAASEEFLEEEVDRVSRRFKVILDWNEDEGGYTVTVPSLPGCVTEGETREEALANAQEAILGYLDVLKAQGKSIPQGDVEIDEVQVEVAV